jgi:hypothetical protein
MASIRSWFDAELYRAVKRHGWQPALKKTAKDVKKGPIRRRLSPALGDLGDLKSALWHCPKPPRCLRWWCRAAGGREQDAQDSTPYF